MHNHTHKPSQAPLAIVTGASGFIGSYLVRELLSKGFQVRVLLRKASKAKNLRGLEIEKAYVDYKNVASIEKALSGNIDYVFHVAGVIKSVTRKGYYTGNVLPTKNILEALVARQLNISRFVLVSSLSACGPSTSLSEPIIETTTPSPISIYGKSKKESENVCLGFKEKIPITIIRPPIVFGEYDLEMLKPFQTIAKGVLPILSGKSEKYLSLIHAKDLIDGTILAAQSPKAIGETYFLTDEVPYTYKEFCQTIQKEYGRKRVLKLHLPDWIPYIPALFIEVFMLITRKPMILSIDKVREIRQDYWICSSKKAKEDLGFSTKLSLKEGVARTIAWARSENLL